MTKRVKLTGPKLPKMTSMVGFRYDTEKKVFLNQIYGKRLPDLLREAADKLVIEAFAKERKRIKVIL